MTRTNPAFSLSGTYTTDRVVVGEIPVRFM